MSAPPAVLTKISIQVEQDEWDRLKAEADRHGLSVAGMIRYHLRRSRRQSELIAELQRTLFEDVA